MIRVLKIIFVCAILFVSLSAKSQDSMVILQDSLNLQAIKDYRIKLEEIAKQHEQDSLHRLELEAQLRELKAADIVEKEQLRLQLQEISDRETKSLDLKRARIDSMRINARAYPVIGELKDTLFFIYAKLGASTAKDRALNISRKLSFLYENDFLKMDSIITLPSENSVDIVYGETIIMNVSETDAVWNNSPPEELAERYLTIIKESIVKAKKESSLYKILLRFGLMVLIIGGVWFLIRLSGRGYSRLIRYSIEHKAKWLKSLSYKDYTFLSEDQQFKMFLFLLKILRWVLVAIILYIALPLIFSIFPFTRGWADSLFNLIWSPLKGLFIAIWAYLPNLFAILVIFFVMKYFIKLVKYIFSEIEAEKLNISGFHADWAMPTFSIVRFLLYAFMFVLIFPYLPGSDSNIFKGVSVFLGILFSLGSSTAIANIIAGLVITYMRPFKIGDRIKIGDTVGEVVEKTLLVTRLRTIKNEEITIPNASILSGSTINFSFHEKSEGLIIHATISIGYDTPWKIIHEALIEAALRTEHILNEPGPFVLQVSLDDFYVSYQINAYIRDANIQAVIYSSLNQNIQDVFNEKGIEIMSPHYRSERDGNRTTIPADYLPKD